jgi:rare lipoprotein A (peptidoglycan hydrolase)
MRRIAAAFGALRVGLALVAAVAVGATALPGAAASELATADPRARRAELLVRIAELTDSLEHTHARVVAAQLARTRLADRVAEVRARVRARAVRGYIHGVGLGAAAPHDLAAPAAYLEVAARKERQLLSELRAAGAALAEQQRAAESAKDGLVDAGRSLEAARAELDRLVAADDARRLAAQLAAEEAAAQRAAEDARRRAQEAASQEAAEALAANPALLPRHVTATRRQAELMQRYPFGVLSPGPLPDGLALTGERSTGLASWYGGFFNGRPTASGAIYDEEGWTAASRTLPLGTLVVVSRGDVRVLLVINDRGPYIDGRVIDLSASAARALEVGVSEVAIEVVAPV